MKKCFKCGSDQCVKNGKVFGLQRYKCKRCGYQFTHSAPAGKPMHIKLLAHTLYTAGFSMRRIAQVIGITVQSVSQWIKKWHATYIEEVGNADKVCYTDGKHIATFIDLSSDQKYILLQDKLPSEAEVFLIVRLPEEK